MLHLSEEAAYRRQSTRAIERMVAQLAPKSDVAPMIRRLPSITPLRITSPAEQSPATTMVLGSQESRATEAEQEFALDASPADMASAAPSSSENRNLLRITIGGETKSKLDRAGDLLRHTIPDADPAAIIDRALTVLVEQLECTKIAATSRPRKVRSRLESPSVDAVRAPEGSTHRLGS